MRTLPNDLKEQDLREFLYILATKILNKSGPKLSDKAAQDFANSIADQLMQGRDTTVPLKEVTDPSFIKKFQAALTIGGHLEKPEEGSAFETLFKFAKELKRKLDNKEPIDIDKEMQDLKDIILKCYQEMRQELQNAGMKLPTLTPAMSKKIEDDLIKPFDSNTNLLGLINPFITGGYASEIAATINRGNLFGIADMNPNNGSAHIDLQNRTDDVAGNYLGLNQEALNAYVSLGSVSAEETMQAEDLVNEASVHFRHSPKLTHK